MSLNGKLDTSGVRASRRRHSEPNGSRYPIWLLHDEDVAHLSLIGLRQKGKSNRLALAAPTSDLFHVWNSILRPASWSHRHLDKFERSKLHNLEETNEPQD